MADIKNKIDDVLAKKEEPKKEVSDKPSIWTPFAKKIYADIEIYFHKLDGASPTRAVATKFRNEIDTKLEDGKEKDGMIKFYNKRFKLPGVTTQAYNYFAETVIDPKASEKDDAKLLERIGDLIQDATDYDPYDTKVLAKKVLDTVRNWNKKESVVNEETEMKKYLIALPSLKGQKGFNCPTILVKAKDERDAIDQVRHLKPHSNIGDIKVVTY